jgi:hypothetical protein
LPHNLHEDKLPLHENQVVGMRLAMANLQIKGIEDDLYAQLGKIAAAENRSISQQVLYLIKGDLARRKAIQRIPTPAAILLELSGSWAGDEPASAIVGGIRAARKSSERLKQGF